MNIQKIPVEAIQSELLMDMCEEGNPKLMASLKSLGQPGRSPEVMEMEISASRRRAAVVTPLNELLSVYAHLLSQGMFKVILDHPALHSLSEEEKEEFVHDHADLFFATSSSVLANLFDKNIIRYTKAGESSGE
ncbi:hypothetical protein [Streptomyces sp. H27-C3]|uniref:hypothetical protein n=1 Tax=Streptomyces sp. H27-C3 TaxID=3046305 RepID=UPI0024BAF2E5|nr:hypothetical protein [Streptomyces sp. H27-C3]MDJ0463163.1 hypothetical protein [Streptomyces sp. H27-C3]